MNNNNYPFNLIHRKSEKWKHLTFSIGTSANPNNNARQHLITAYFRQYSTH